MTIGIDGGYVRSWTNRPTNFEVIVGKSVSEDGRARRFGFVARHGEKPKRRLHELLVNQGIVMNQEMTFMSDGACNLRDLQYYMRPTRSTFSTISTLPCASQCSSRWRAAYHRRSPLQRPRPLLPRRRETPPLARQRRSGVHPR
ncbi:hypothetical protein [Mesorhizobium carmichaelinearum]|uniref:hypothetical protein n=1 Tax=Mesorhizobium carmichaelinearum TaxID=1208188 RepID=UPI00117FD673|nr:hypothetical protein [Mesorhizobium carmichaelinearum]